MRHRASGSCRCKRCCRESSRVPASKGSGGAGRVLRGLAPGSLAKISRGAKRGQGGYRGLLCAYRDANLGFGGRENLLAILYLVVDRLGGGEKWLVGTFGQQVVRKVQLVEHVACGGAGLNL